MLENIHNPNDIKNLNDSELTDLAEEMRKTILSAVSKNGGHLASNLGVVELTLALHRIFNIPEDKLLFDVGHQCYAHKLLTGRYHNFSTLRTYKGLSGFTNRFESEYDTLTAGHSGPSLSAAIGIATAAKLKGSNAYTICVIGDGSFTNGMIYEALNNCDNKDLRLIIILNDNEMSISPNVGSLPTSFRKMRNSKGYFSFKAGTRRFFQNIPVIGGTILKILTALKRCLKKILVRKNFFECLGLEYIGPVDGHDEGRLELALNEAKQKNKVTLLHVTTKKGKGFAYAEDAPEKFHGISPFDKSTGKTAKSKENFSDRFGNIMEKLANKDDKIIAVTAAMCEGTGLVGFRDKFPQRFFDVGIAEEHAVTFSSGLSLSGYKPICVMYSTFAQRTFDQLMHDVSLQSIPLIIALDRAGIVPGDGITHQGIFDIPLFSTLPNTQIYSPQTFLELENILTQSAKDYSSITIIRYPKGHDAKEIIEMDKFAYIDVSHETSPDIIVITYGRITSRISEAIKLSSKKIRLIKLKRVFPIDIPDLLPQFCGCKNIIFFEESIRRGGIGEYLFSNLALYGINFKIKAIDDYIDHGDIDNLLAHAGFSTKEIISELENTF